MKIASAKFIRRTVSRLFSEKWKKRIKFELFEVPDTEHSLRRMKRIGFEPHRVIDVGAYAGDWTRICKRVFPQAQVLMIEPQVSKVPELNSVASELTNIEVRTVLLGANEKASVPFFEAATASSVLRESEKAEASSSSLPMTTLDALIDGGSFDKPDFIKLDVQGYELEVLKGGERAMLSAEVVLMEVNLLGIYHGVPLFDEGVQFMAERGFRVYDICTFYRRPYDGALWQVDVIFVRNSSKLLSSKRWA